MSASPSVAARLDRSRRDLLDLTLRNSLLDFRPSKTRGLTITGEIPREIFRIIARDERLMYFLPTGSSGEDESLEAVIPRALLSSITEYEDPSAEPAAHHVDNQLQTPYSATHLEIRLKNTFRAAHTNRINSAQARFLLLTGLSSRRDRFPSDTDPSSKS